MEQLVGVSFYGGTWIFAREQFQQGATIRFDVRRVRLDYHPVQRRRIARGGMLVPSFYVDDTEPACTGRVQAFIVA
jgi:hypothetical protein